MFTQGLLRRGQGGLWPTFPAVAAGQAGSWVLLFAIIAATIAFCLRCLANAARMAWLGLVGGGR